MKNREEKRNRIVSRVTWFVIIGNFILAISKIIIGNISSSKAVVGDGIDSSADVISSIITLIAVKIMAQPPDEDHHYGHNRAETLATLILSFLVFFAGAQLSYSSIISLFENTIKVMPSQLAIYVTILSITGKLLMAFFLYIWGKKLKSTMLSANSKNMQGDVVISASVLIGLGAIYFFKLPILDTILAVLIGIWVMKVGIDIFREIAAELMEGHSDKSLYNEIFSVIDMIPDVQNPHRMRIRNVGSHLFIDLDIEVDPDLTVHKGHDIAKIVEKQIRQNIENVQDVMIHVEPRGNMETESFGIKRDHLEPKG